MIAKKYTIIDTTLQPTLFIIRNPSLQSVLFAI